MSLIQEKWNGAQCRFEEGIFFFNDEYISLQRNLDDTFQLGARSSIEKLIDEDPDGWADLNAACEYSDEKYIAISGVGSLEGEGFIALVEKSSKNLEWLLHLESVEIINQVAIEECCESSWF